jgi:hypothetical protein
LIITDDVNSVSYVKEITGQEPIIVNKEDIIKNDISPNPNTGKYSPHNLYLNTLNNEINEGWVMYLDDDDMLYSNTVIEEMVSNIECVNTMLIFQMETPTKSRIPKTKTIRLGGIGSPCVLFHSKYKNFAVWDGWKCSDFRVINRLSINIPNKKWVMKPFVKLNQVGMGNRKDIKLKKD